jgi:hypothetical protein
MDEVFGKEIKDLIQLGLLEKKNTHLPEGEGPQGGEVPRSGLRVRLTRRGRLLGNQAFLRFVT